MYLTGVIDKDSKGIDKSMLAYGVALTAVITAVRYIFELTKNNDMMLYSIIYYCILILITIFQMNKYRKSKEYSRCYVCCNNINDDIWTNCNDTICYNHIYNIYNDRGNNYK